MAHIFHQILQDGFWRTDQGYLQYWTKNIEELIRGVPRRRFRCYRLPTHTSPQRSSSRATVCATHRKWWVSPALPAARRYSPPRCPARGATPGSARPAPRAGASRPPSGRAPPWSPGSSAHPPAPSGILPSSEKVKNFDYRYISIC